MRNTFRRTLRGGFVLAVLGPAANLLHAAEHVTLRNGFEIDCARRQAIEGDGIHGDRVRLFLLPSRSAEEKLASSYIDVDSDAVVSVEDFPDPVLPAVVASGTSQVQAAPTQAAQTQAAQIQAELTPAEMHTMLARAGTQHHIDEDLLASVVKAESGGRVMAVSRTGARGLMQLMPGTAGDLGVADAFRAEQNIAGGTAYLDQLLVRYHDNAALALAAYNAGPGAVDKYHGIPPYRETRAYVARVIREFNRRKIQAPTVAQTAGKTVAQTADRTQVAGLR